MKTLSQNIKCYIKDELLSAENESLEHVIPNALGGHLKSKQLVCSEINTGMFSKLDAELCKRIEIAKLIKFKRDDGKNQPEIIGTSNDGLKYSVNNTQHGKLLSVKPIEHTDENGKRFLKFPLHQKNEVISARLKKNPLLKEENIEIKIENEDTYNRLDFQNGLNIITSTDSFRAIAKIATNFYILKNGDKKYILDIVDFIIGAENISKINLGYFYPEEFLNIKLEDSEVSHILYLKGCKKEKVLYCYVELFNCHCFVVILNSNYSGPEIQETYIWNLVNSKEIDENIFMDISIDIILKPRGLYSDAVVKFYAARLSRLNQIYGLKLSVK